MPSETQTGGLFVRTTTTTHVSGQAPSVSTSLSFNPSITSILGTFGIENNSGINVGVGFDGTFSSNGLSFSGSTNIQSGQLSANVSGSGGFNTTEWFNANASAQVGWGNHTIGGGIHAPTNPLEHFRIFGFHQERDGNTTTRNEVGGHVQMGVGYIAVLAWKLVPFLAPFLKPLIFPNPVFGASAISALLAFMNNISHGFENQCEE